MHLGRKAGKVRFAPCTLLKLCLLSPSSEVLSVGACLFQSIIPLDFDTVSRNSTAHLRQWQQGSLPPG